MNLFFDREAEAIALMKQWEPVQGFYLSFSGGKDSVVLHEIAKKAGVKFEAHFHNTTIEAPETYRFIARYFPDVTWDKPRMTMRAAIIDHQLPPTRIVRYCCEELKECHGTGRTILTGIRKKESTARGKRKQLEVDYKTNDKIFLQPIFGWTNEEVWDYILKYALPVNPLYGEGRKRIGCVMCPMSGSEGMKRDAKRWPQIARRYQQYFQEMLGYWTAKGKEYRHWKTGDDVFQWWITKPEKRKVQEEDFWNTEAVAP